MKKEHNKIDRRNFLKTVGAVGVGSVLSSVISEAGPNEPNVNPAPPRSGVNEPNTPAKPQEQKFPQVPRRKLGKTGIEVPVLSFGAMFDIVENQVILRGTLQRGVNYWDTASSYAGGNSELGIGKFFSKNPDVRKEIFLVTKASDAKKKPTPKAVVERAEVLLQESLKKMNTDYIDLYCGVHGLKDPAQLDDEMRHWAEDAKKRRLIRFFGFSNHDNMAQCLEAAAKLGWIDAILVKYNFRLMQDAKMQAAIEACHKAGIGLIAMKSQALRRVEPSDVEPDKKLIDHFQQSGFTEGQAKIKAVLEDERICSVCVGMQSIALLTENAEAVLNKTKLSRADVDVLSEYAKATCSGYCAGCSHICDSALPDAPYISDIMRYLTYYNSYGDRDRARELFARIPADVRSRLPGMDYRLAEALCPQHIPIGEAVAEAVSKLA